MTEKVWHVGDTETFRQDVQDASGSPIPDLSGATFEFSVFDEAGTETVSKTTPDFELFSGYALCQLAETDLDPFSVKPGRYSWSSRVTQADGSTQSDTGEISIVAPSL